MYRVFQAFEGQYSLEKAYAGGQKLANAHADASLVVRYVEHLLMHRRTIRTVLRFFKLDFGRWNNSWTIELASYLHTT